MSTNVNMQETCSPKPDTETSQIEVINLSSKKLSADEWVYWKKVQNVYLLVKILILHSYKQICRLGNVECGFGGISLTK